MSNEITIGRIPRNAIIFLPLLARFMGADECIHFMGGGEFIFNGHGLILKLYTQQCCDLFSVTCYIVKFSTAAVI